MQSIMVNAQDVCEVSQFIKSRVGASTPPWVAAILRRWQDAASEANADSIRESMAFYDNLRQAYEAHKSMFVLDSVTFNEVKDAVLAVGIEPELRASDNLSLDFVSAIPTLCESIRVRRVVV